MSRTDRYEFLVTSSGRTWDVADNAVNRNTTVRRAQRHGVWLERALCRILRLTKETHGEHLEIPCPSS
jgi:hypothetical protein